jgi:replication protein C-like
MKTAPQIFRWLDSVKADRRLCASSFKIAYQLSNRTNTAEFKKSGRLITWQAIPTLAAATGLSDRTVRRAIRRLQATGHLTVKIGGGRGKSNRYTLAPQTLSPVAVFNEPKPCQPLQGFAGQTLSSATLNPDKSDPKPCHQWPGNLSRKDFSNLCSAPDRDSEDASRRPRSLEGLGPLDAELHCRLGENFKWLAMAKLADRTADTVTLSVLTASQRDAIIKHCETDILAAAGASELKFVVEIAADPPKARRRP